MSNAGKNPKRLVQCDLCGMMYVAGILSDERYHRRLHDLALAARRVFARAHPDFPELPISYAAREAMKRGAYTAAGGLDYAIAHYARSWEATDYSPKHPSFEQYVRGMLMTPRIRLAYGADVVRRYPPKSLRGLDVGTSYWRADNV
jgi:hypothetical protein